MSSCLHVFMSSVRLPRDHLALFLQPWKTPKSPNPFNRNPTSSGHSLKSQLVNWSNWETGLWLCWNMDKLNSSSSVPDDSTHSGDSLQDVKEKRNKIQPDILLKNRAGANTTKSRERKQRESAGRGRPRSNHLNLSPPPTSSLSLSLFLFPFSSSLPLLFFSLLHHRSSSSPPPSSSSSSSSSSSHFSLLLLHSSSPSPPLLLSSSLFSTYHFCPSASPPPFR